MRAFWDNHPEIHSLYRLPVVVMPDSAVAYVGYGLYVMLVLASGAGMVRHPYPSYIKNNSDIGET